jgi:ATP-binding cassette, subfamily C, bacterial
MLASKWRTLRLWGHSVHRVLGLAPRGKCVLVILALFVASLFELIGLTMIVPLMGIAAQVRDTKPGLVTAIRESFASLGLPFEPSFLLGVIILGLACKAAISIAVSRYVGDLVADITAEFQIALSRSLLRARWSYFVRQPLGRLVHAAGAEAAAVGAAFQAMTGMFANVMQGTLFLVVAALLSWKLLAFALLVGLAMFLSFGKLVQDGRAAARQHRHQMREHAAQFTDAMIGIKPVRAMGRTDHFERMFEDEARGMANTLRRRVLSADFIGELQEPVIGSIIAVMFFVALHSLTLRLEEVMIMMILLIRIVSAFAPLQTMLQRFITSYDQFKSLIELLAETQAEAEPRGGTLQPGFQRSIRFERVSFSYGARAVLDELDLEIRRGEITSICGPSGVGKSTIVDLLVGLLRPQAGRLLVDGIDLAELDLGRWRRSIGYVPQEVTLFHDTILQNVRLWQQGVGEEEVERALRAAGAWPFVEERPGKLHAVVGERGHALSGGQRQRLSLARALLHRPRLLILDEATTGLDPETEAGICAQIRQLCRDQGLSVVAVSHQLAWQRAADRAFLIENGRARPLDCTPLRAAALAPQPAGAWA